MPLVGSETANMLEIGDLETVVEDCVDDDDPEAAGRSLDDARAAAAAESARQLPDGAAVSATDRARRGDEANEMLPLWVEMIAARNNPSHCYHQHMRDLPALPPGLAAWPSKVRLYCLPGISPCVPPSVTVFWCFVCHQ